MSSVNIPKAVVTPQMFADQRLPSLVTQTASDNQLQNHTHTMLRTSLPASLLFVVGPTPFSSSPSGVPLNLIRQSSLPVSRATEKKLLLPRTVQQIASSPKKKFRKVSVPKDVSVPKKKRGRPRRSAPSITSSTVNPRPILPRVDEEESHLIAIAGQQLDKLSTKALANYSAGVPCVTTESYSTTSLPVSNNLKYTNNSSHCLTPESTSKCASHLETTQHVAACDGHSESGIQLNGKEERIGHRCVISENGSEKLIETKESSFRTVIKDVTIVAKSTSDLAVANLAVTQSTAILLKPAVYSGSTVLSSTGSDSVNNLYDCTVKYQNDSTEFSKPLVIKSSSLLQPASNSSSENPITIIKISTCSQSPITVPEMTRLTSFANVSSSVSHCTTALSSSMTRIVPMINNDGNDNQSFQKITSKSSVLTCQSFNTEDSAANNNAPTFSSCGIEHDEPLDPSIVQRLNGRLNSGSKNASKHFMTDSEEPDLRNIQLVQKQGYCSETRQLKLTGLEITERKQHNRITEAKKVKKTFLCQVCGKIIIGHSNLKSHLLTHSSARPHVCHVCNKGFLRRHTFHIHLRTHTNENPYTCSRCPAAFKTRSNMVRHEAVHTTRNRDYRCQECGKEFTSKHSLNSHRKVHAAVTGPFVCSQCGEVYTTMQSLRTHQLHHKYPDKQFKCKLCDKAYVFKSLLKRHMDGHNGVQKFHCHLCLTTFAWKSSLAAHILTHYPKKFNCKLCSLSFSSEKRLVSHLKKHSEPKPHSCTLCLKKFPFRYLLVRHVKSAHGHKSFVSVKAKAVPRKAYMPRRIKNRPFEGSSKTNAGASLDEGTPNASADAMCGEQIQRNCPDGSRTINDNPTQVPFPSHPAGTLKIPMYKFRCVNAEGELLPSKNPQFTVSFGQEKEYSIVARSNTVKQEKDPKKSSIVSSQETNNVADSVTERGSVVASRNADGCCNKPSSISSISNSYREPPPSYFLVPPRGVEGKSDTPKHSHHASVAISSPRQAVHTPASASSSDHDSYTPSYETCSSFKPSNDLQSSPSLVRYQRSGGLPHPNLLPASSDPYLQAASSTHSAYFPSPPPTYDTPSRHPSTCGSSHQASYNLPTHLQPNYESSPTQQSHGGLLYLSAQQDYQLDGCLAEETLPGGESS